MIVRLPMHSFFKLKLFILHLFINNAAVVSGKQQRDQTHIHVPTGSDGKHLSAMQETRVRSLHQEDPLEKETATHSSTLA